MKKLKSVVGVALCLVVSACGLGGKNQLSPLAKSYSGTAGSCTDYGKSTCQELSYSGVVTKDPKSDADSSLRSMCKGLSVSPSPCSRTSAVGYCKVSNSEKRGNESFTATGIAVYYSPITVSNARMSCAGSGTFSTTSP